MTERLTEVENGTAMVKGCGSNCKYGFEYCRKEDWENCKTIDDVIDKLAEYEDLEEQGLLLRLPCKVGDTVYIIYSDKETSFIEEPIVKDVSTHRIWIESRCYDYLDIGKTIFLTQAEAEQKLKEMESD